MNSLKRIAAFLLAALFVIAALPAFAIPARGPEAENDRGLNTNVTIDTDPAGGYAGDYVVICNTGDPSVSASTGSLAGKVVTDLSANVLPLKSVETAPVNEDIPYIIDVDYEVSQNHPDIPAPEFENTRDAYVVGSTRTFGLYNYPPVSGYEMEFQFKVLYVGRHCYIWTPTNADYHPLDGINADYARIAAEKFDEKFELMQIAYGDFNDVAGDGKVNLLFYDIGDGWQPGQGYVAGYFWSEDFRFNNAAMIHVDTYPGIAYTNANGVYIDHFDDCFGTIVHEFQHCINYSETGGMAVWLNEALSGSAEELCFPGSGLFERIPSWHNYKFSGVAELQNPPVEYDYDPGFGLHTGGSLTAWNSSERDIFARYAEVMLFTQYLYTRYGSSSVFKNIIEANSGDTIADSLDALTTATGWSMDSIWQGFFTSMIANDLGSGYGFLMNEGYDPDDYYGLDTLYSLLSPVVYTSTEAAEIYGGGFITIKPVGGVFVPPADASSSLKYIGVTVGEVGLEGIAITPAETTMLLNETAKLVVERDPLGANNYEMIWTSSDDSIASVAGNRFAANVTSHAPGSVTITATATDKETGTVYTAAASVTVEDGQSYTKYVPVDSIETGKEYMIGASYNGNVYVLMNYNPDAPDFDYYSDENYCMHYQSTEYSWGVKAEVNDQGEIIGLDGSDYPNAAPKMAEWLFYDSDGYEGCYIIRSAYNRSYHLRIANYDNNSGLYPQDGSSYSYKWVWDQENSSLYYAFKSNVKKRITFVPSVNGQSNMFYAPNAAASVQLYKKVTGIIMNEDYFTVTFKDWDGTVISTQQVEPGASAVAPADPAREGFTFTGWDVDFTNVTSNLTVTAQYQANSYTLTVIYQYADGSEAAPAHTGEYVYNSAYSVISPEIEGYTADKPYVVGAMPAHDLTITVTYTANEQPVVNIGDVDCDGDVDFDDVTLLNAYLLNAAELSEQGLINANVNGDNKVSSADVVALNKLILGSN